MKIQILLALGATGAVLLAWPPAATADEDLDSALGWFDSFDQGRDGTVTIEEMQASGAKRFRRADRDGNGALDATEYIGGIPEGDDAERERYLRRFQATDSDLDGMASKDEYDAFLARVVRTADSDGDGVMTRTEFEFAVTGDEPDGGTEVPANKTN